MTKKPILKVQRNSKLLDLVNPFPQNLDSLKIKMQNLYNIIRFDKILYILEIPSII
jgi:hypothetical protein